MTIDNFDIIKSKLTFETQFDRYIIHVLKRAKDEDGRKYGVNNTNRLIKSFYITSIEYFDKKIPVIKDLCDSYSARAYILPQVRNNEECLRELLKVVVDNLSNPTSKPDHLIRTAFCGYHGSRDKKWILDLDNDNLIEYKSVMGFPCEQISMKQWSPKQILEFVQRQLEAIGKSKDSAYMIPTKSGHCIVTSPFNLQKAHDECTMMFQGVHSITVDTKKVKNEGCSSILPYFYESIKKDVNGWIIKDGMALLYLNSKDD